MTEKQAIKIIKNVLGINVALTIKELNYIGGRKAIMKLKNMEGVWLITIGDKNVGMKGSHVITTKRLFT